MHKPLIRLQSFWTVLGLIFLAFWGFTSSAQDSFFTLKSKSSTLFSEAANAYFDAKEPQFTAYEINYLELVKVKASIMEDLTSIGEFPAPWNNDITNQHRLVDHIVMIDKLASEAFDLEGMMLDNDIERPLRDMARLELKKMQVSLQTEISQMRETLWNASVPKVSGDVIIEILPNPSKPESPLAIGLLQKFYENLARYQGWDYELISSKNDEKHAGILVDGSVRLHHAFIKISGDDVFRKLSLESGAHRVIHTDNQLIGAAFKGNNVTHTNYALVRVYATPKKSTFAFREEDIEFQFIRSTGAGGQHINKTSSAVRAKHIPSGLSVLVQKERDQHMNKRLAIETLRAMLFTQHLESEEKELSKLRADSEMSNIESQSPYVRTYNFKQDILGTERLISGQTPPDSFNEWQNFMNQKLIQMTADLAKEVHLLSIKYPAAESFVIGVSSENSILSAGSCELFLD